MSQTDPNTVEQRPNYQEELQVMGEQLLSEELAVMYGVFSCEN